MDIVYYVTSCNIVVKITDFLVFLVKIAVVLAPMEKKRTKQ
jgi:hypothetical protein